MGFQRKTDDSLLQNRGRRRKVLAEIRPPNKLLVQGENGLEVYVMIEIPSNDLG
jgi:phosphoenolpyruvate synthase/pyruvate phosphate dikinase